MTAVTWSAGQLEHLLLQERRLVPIRWAGVGLVLGVAALFTATDVGLHSSWWAPAVAMATANLWLHLTLPNIRQEPGPVLRLLVLATLFDWIAVGFLGTAWVYDTFFGNWPSLLVIPLIGALRFAVVGAMVGWAVSVVLYLLTATLTSTFDRPVVLEPTTLIYRLGLMLLMSLAVGYAARNQALSRARAERTLEQLRRSEAWRARLVATLGHDVRSPLGTVVSGVQLLRLRGDELPPSVREDTLDAIERQSVAALRLADDLLDMARLEHGTFSLTKERVNVVDVARRVVGGDRDVAVEAATEPMPAIIDAPRVEQLLVNLVANARKHGRPPITIVLQDDDETVEIAVEDCGSGLPVQGREQFFEAFAHGGAAASTGLGLWIVTALTEAHGGTVSYRDGRDGGACFVVRLPRWGGADGGRAGVDEGEVLAGADPEDRRNEP